MLPEFLALLALAPAGDTTSICLAPATVEASVGDATTAAGAVGQTFAGFLSGPSLRTQALSARLAGQVHEEARQSGCAYLLLPTFRHEHKRKGGSVVGRMAAGAAQAGTWEAGIGSKTAAGRVAAQAAYGAAGQAAYNYAYSVQDKDEITLGYRLEGADGKVLVEKEDHRKAHSDGEDLLTPMVQQASEAIVAAIGR